MAKKREEMIFYYRGLIESRSGWIEGYSTTTAEGNIMFPWYGKRVCQADAKICGKKAVFVRNVPNPQQEFPNV